jgi:hypothetical protein
MVQQKGHRKMISALEAELGVVRIADRTAARTRSSKGRRQMLKCSGTHSADFLPCFRGI